MGSKHNSAGSTGIGSPRGLGREAATVLLLCAVSITLFSLIFPPLTIWPLAFVCLVPWAVAACRTARPWLVYWVSFLGGWVFFLVNLVWLMPVTGLGYAALAFYLALYWPLAAWAIRTGRRYGIGVVWTLPAVWVACEYLRAWVMSGFPWLFLSHAFYQQLSLIQISDVTGAYGVSFLVALVNGVLVELVLQVWRVAGKVRKLRHVLIGTGVAAALIAGVLHYGNYRLGQGEFIEGPKVAVVQADFPLASTPPYGDPPQVVLSTYLSLGAAAAMQRPDLLVFPETAWNSAQNIEFIETERAASEKLSAWAYSYGRLCDYATSALARGDYIAVNTVIEERFEKPAPGRRLPRLPRGHGPAVTLAVGSVAIEEFPEAAYPNEKRYNSVLVYDKNGKQRRKRYDKNHLVPFGEYVPFRNARLLGLNLHWLYRRLNSLSPFSDGGKNDYSLTPGEELVVFKLEGDGKVFRFGTPICYEGVMPYVIRDFVWDGSRRRVDFLLNLSNDGWFLHGDELPQHLAVYAFRAVENRIGIARAVNTGISGFIDPNGRIYSLVEKDGRAFGPGIVGYSVDRILIDRRGSFYGRFGDLFAGLCLLFSAALWLGAVVTRWLVALKRRVAALVARGGK